MTMESLPKPSHSSIYNNNRELAIVSFEMAKLISKAHIREGIENKNP